MDASSEYWLLLQELQVLCVVVPWLVPAGQLTGNMELVGQKWPVGQLRLTFAFPLLPPMQYLVLVQAPVPHPPFCPCSDPGAQQEYAVSPDAGWFGQV